MTSPYDVFRNPEGKPRMLTYRLRAETTAVILHDSHTPPSQSDVQHFLAVGGREKGLLDIGYHFLILRDGQLIECRPHAVQGTHLRSKRNRDTIGVCLAGGLVDMTCSNRDLPTLCDDCLRQEGHEHRCRAHEDNFTPAQWSTFRDLFVFLHKAYPAILLLGHSEIDKGHHGACPAVDMTEVRVWLQTRTGSSPTVRPPLWPAPKSQRP